MREGVEGYGIYWMLLEMLRDCPSYKTFFFPESFAYAMHCSDVEKVTRVCKDYCLFEFDKEENMWSPWLCKAMGEYDDRKAKLREAGKKGAAHRWGSSSRENGEAIATPLLENGEAIAHNATLPNMSLHDITLPDLSGSPRVSEELVEALCKTQPKGHASGYVAQICLQYGMSEGALNFLCEHSNNAEVTNPTYQKFCALVKRIQTEKWVPKHPDGFFLKKVFE